MMHHCFKVKNKFKIFEFIFFFFYSDFSFLGEMPASHPRGEQLSVLFLNLLNPPTHNSNSAVCLIVILSFLSRWFLTISGLNPETYSLLAEAPRLSSF